MDALKASGDVDMAPAPAGPNMTETNARAADLNRAAGNFSASAPEPSDDEAAAGHSAVANGERNKPSGVRSSR